MVSAAKGLLASLLRERDASLLRRVDDAGIQAKHFTEQEDREAYEFIRSYLVRYGRMPSAEVVEVETGIDIPRVLPPEPLEFWIDEVRSEYIIARAVDIQEQIVGALRTRDTKTIRELFRDAWFDLERAAGDVRLVSLAQASERVLEEHAEARVSEGQLIGIPFGWHYLDTATGGARPGDCIVLVARTGVGKSYVLGQWALNAFNAGHRVLFVTMEMSPEHVAQRLVALGARVNPTALRRGTMSEFGLRVVNAFLDDRVRSRDPDDFALMPGNMRLSSADIALRVAELRPDVVFVDGAYMVTPTDGKGLRANWERIEQSTIELKQVAMQYRVPMILSHQFNREGPKGGLTSIARSDAIGQIASVVMGLEHEESGRARQVGPSMTRLLRIFKGRDGEEGLLRLEYRMDLARIVEAEVLEGHYAFGVDIPQDGGDDLADDVA